MLVGVLEDDPEWADWSIGQLRAQSKVHPLAINPMIYSELSLTFSTVEALECAVDDLGLAMIEIPRSALLLAGKAFVRYRRQGGKKSNVLADFFIGAHAAVSRYPILSASGVFLVGPWRKRSHERARLDASRRRSG